MTDALDRDELAAWLRLAETPKVGRESARKLLSCIYRVQQSSGMAFGAERSAEDPAKAMAALQALWGKGPQDRKSVV